MKKLNIVLISVFCGLLFSCGNSEKSTPKNKIKIDKKTEVSFNKLYQNGNLIVCYTDDSDSLWTDIHWRTKIRSNMSRLKDGNLNVLLFNSKENTPNISVLGFDYPTSYDKNMVCGYWRFNYERFCYGGVDEENNFIECIEFVY